MSPIPEDLLSTAFPEPSTPVRLDSSPFDALDVPIESDVHLLNEQASQEYHAMFDDTQDDDILCEPCIPDPSPMDREIPRSWGVVARSNE